jgi:hypothetical protein
MFDVQNETPKLYDVGIVRFCWTGARGLEFTRKRFIKAA